MPVTSGATAAPEAPADEGRDVYVFVPEPLYLALHAAAEQEGRTMAALIRSAVAAYLERRPAAAGRARRGRVE